MSAATQPRGGAAPDLAACLNPLLDALGWMGERRRLLEAQGGEGRALDLPAFLNTMANLRFRGEPLAAAGNDIRGRQLPCLFLPDDGGAWVLLRREGDQFFGFDGTQAAFARVAGHALRGRAVFFTPAEAGTGTLFSRQPDWSLRALLRFRGLFAVALLLSLVLSLLALASPLLTAFVFDRAMSGTAGLSMGGLLAGVVLFLSAEAGTRFLRERLMAFVGGRMSLIVGNEIYRRILRLPLAWSEAAPVSAQVSRVRDFESVRDFFSGPAAILLDLPFTLVLLLAMAFLAGPLAFVPLAAAVVLALAALVLRPMVRERTLELAGAAAQRQDFHLELASRLPDLRRAGASRRFLERYRRASGEAAWRSLRAAELTADIQALSAGVSALAMLVMVVLGVSLVLDGRLSAGSLMAATLLAGRLLSPLRAGFAIAAQLEKLRRSVEQLDRFMNLPQEGGEAAVLSSERGVASGVQLSQVSLRYAADANPALVGVSFQARPNEVVALTGHDGAGKSTVLKLLLGLYTPQAGSVTIGHLAVRQMDPGLLRRTVAYAPQECRFFSGSIEDNLRLADPGATPEALQAALERAGCRREVEELGGLARILSAGEAEGLRPSLRRRLVLARAFLRRGSPLLLLDEPEAGLTEEEVGRLAAEIRASAGTATVLLATAHPRLLAAADRVLELDRGRLKELAPGTRGQVSV